MPDVILPLNADPNYAGADTDFDKEMAFMTPEPVTEPTTDTSADQGAADNTDTGDNNTDTDNTVNVSDELSKPIADLTAGGAQPKPTTKPATDKPAGDPQNSIPAKPSVGSEDKRDYSKYPEELRDYFKRLPRHLLSRAEEHLIPMLNKAKERDAIATERDNLQAQLAERPSFAHEHPQGYVLDPEYQKLDTELYRGQTELEFYQEQLARVNAGQDWQDTVAWDKQTGQLHTRPIPALGNGQIDAQAHALLMRKITSATVYTNTRFQQKQQFEQGYQAQAQAARSELTEIESKIFSKIKPENFTPSEKRLNDMAVQAFPRAYRNHPVTKYIGWAAVAVQRNNEGYADLLGKYKALLAKGTARSTPRATGSVMPAQHETERPIKFDDVLAD